MPRGIYTRKTLTARFLAFVEKSPTCWLWTGNVGGTMGYGAFWMNGRNERAHRAAWAIFVGEIPAGKLVLHRCDRPRCVNPEHLFLGTQAENMRDKSAKGRCKEQRGEANYMAKLSWEKVRTIRALAAEGRTQASIAKAFGLSQPHVGDIVNGVCWKEAP